VFDAPTYDGAMNEATPGIGAQATEAIGLFIAAVEAIPPESWDIPSNLEGWSVRDLVGHATGSAAKIVTLAEDGTIWDRPSEPADWVCANPAARLRELAAALRDALPGADFDGMRVSPQGEVPLHRALLFPVVDVALHSWDVHRSHGRLVELPDAQLALARGLVESVPEAAMRRTGAFGPARSAPEWSTPTGRLMAYLGRSIDD
jgi:uncharacterized protein (TIGR03086 family)